MPWRRAWQPSPVFLPGKSHGQRSLAGCRTWDRNRVGLDSAVKQQERWKKQQEKQTRRVGTWGGVDGRGAPLRVAWLWGAACLLQWAFAFTAKKQEWFPFFFFLNKFFYLFIFGCAGSWLWLRGFLWLWVAGVVNMLLVASALGAQASVVMAHRLSCS